MIVGITVSYSELYDARRCALRHELKWVEGWEKDPPPDSPRAIGIAWHKVLAAYYTAIKNNTGALLFDVCTPVIQEEHPDIQERLFWMLNGYCQRYGNEPEWTVIDTEVPFKFTAPLREGEFDDVTEVTIKGKIDLIIRDWRGQVWVDDHKSCDAIPGNKNDPIDDQLPLMVWAAEQMGHKVLGARYSYSRRKPLVKRELSLDERYWRRLVPVVAATQNRAMLGAVRTAYSRYFESERLNRLATRNGKQGMLSDPPASLQRSCKFDCDYVRPCIAASKGMNLRQQLEVRGFARWREDRKQLTEGD